MPDIVVVTGSSQGLGRAIADRFLKGGFTVVGLDLQVLDNTPFDTIVTDITDRNAVSRAFEQVVQQYGLVAVCINAAGVYPRSTVADYDEKSYRMNFDINVWGTWLVATHFADCAAAGGVLLNISSVDGMTPEPKSLLYSASKAAVINLTSGIAPQFADRGLRVIGVAPGYIATETVKKLAGTLPPDTCEPSDVAEAVWRLTSDGGIPLVSGDTIVVRARPNLDS